MFAKIVSLAVLVAASAVLAPAATAVPHSIDVRVGPPAPRYEAVPAPRRGYVWAPGYWDRRGQQYAWTRGTWVRERPGYVYTQPAWVNDGGRYRFNRGAWARGDRDRDGAPNRVDRHPNNPNRN